MFEAAKYLLNKQPWPQFTRTLFFCLLMLLPVTCRWKQTLMQVLHIKYVFILACVSFIKIHVVQVVPLWILQQFKNALKINQLFFILPVIYFSSHVFSCSGSKYETSGNALLYQESFPRTITCCDPGSTAPTSQPLQHAARAHSNNTRSNICVWWSGQRSSKIGWGFKDIPPFYG